MSLNIASSSSIGKYTPFGDIIPFTTTLVGDIKGGGLLNLKEIVNQLTCKDVNFQPKEGKKVKIDVMGNPGDILGLKAKVDGQLVVKGINKGTKAFNNCISIIITVSDGKGKSEKNIDFKLFKDKIQTTGSKTIHHTTEAWDYIKSYLISMENICSSPIQSLEITNLKYKMIDKSFNLGFKVIRDKLRTIIDKKNGFHVIWEAGVDSNGVSVKYPLEKSESDEITMNKKKMPRCISFIVFTTGSVIISGDDFDIMERVYNLFRETINLIRDDIELKINK